MKKVEGRKVLLHLTLLMADKCLWMGMDGGRARKSKSMIKDRWKGEKKQSEEIRWMEEERNLQYWHRGTAEGVPLIVWKQGVKWQRGRSGIPLTQTSTPTHSGNGFITELPPPDFTHPWSQTPWGHQEALMCIIPHNLCLNPNWFMGS